MKKVTTKSSTGTATKSKTKTASSGNSETLKDALIRVGDKSHVSGLTAPVQKMTKSEVIDYLNGKKFHHLTLADIASMRKLARLRIKEGKAPLPFDNMSKLNSEDEHSMGGGCW